MSKDSFKYYSYHVYPKSLKRVQLFKDNGDKLAYILALANTCIDLDFSLFGFDVMNNHAHFMVGIKWFSQSKPQPNWLDEKIRKFIWNVNRHYGKHYRNKYHFSGRIYAKNKDFFKPVHHNSDFVNKIRYIQNNACSIGKYQVFEDNPFTSYNFYIAAFVHNPEFQSLPVITQITTSVTFLPVFQALDLVYTITQFDHKKTLSAGVLKFIEAHRNALLERDSYFKHSSSSDRYRILKIDSLLNNPFLLQITNTKGHKVKRFIDNLALDEINRKNFAEFSHSFSSFFPWHEKVFAKNPLSALKESFFLIRKEYISDFNRFVVAIRDKISINLIHTTTGISRYYISNLPRD